jgi:hypothetical protein
MVTDVVGFPAGGGLELGWASRPPFPYPIPTTSTVHPVLSLCSILLLSVRAQMRRATYVATAEDFVFKARDLQNGRERAGPGRILVSVSPMKTSLIALGWLRDFVLVLLLVAGNHIRHGAPLTGIVIMVCAAIIFAERFLWSWHLSDIAETECSDTASSPRVLPRDRL